MKLILFLCAIAFASAAPAENGKRLIKTSESDPGSWLTLDEISQLRLSLPGRQGFVDITNDPDFTLENVPLRNPSLSIPTELRFQTDVNSLIAQANQSRVEKFLDDFSAYYNRHLISVTGVESQKWLLSQAELALVDYSGRSSVQELFSNFEQKNIVARIEGVHPQLKDEVVIIGAHLDSIAGTEHTKAPGADDNASGSSVVLEALRLISAANIRLNRTIEFHWYAAEEIGLVGSHEVAEAYANNSINVVAMLNLDVVGYHPNGADYVGIYTDFVNPTLTQFVRILVDEYLTYDRRDNECGYGCSDHASWTRFGYPAAMSSEFHKSPFWHTTIDTVDWIEIEQIMEFVKLAIGFMIEMGEPN